MVYFGIKYYEDNRNRHIIETVKGIFENLRWPCFCVAADMEVWGAVKFAPAELMKKTFEGIDKCKVILIDISEKGVGLGIESGYAYSKGKPIVVMAKKSSDIPGTLTGIMNEIIWYEELEELENKLANTMSKYIWE